MSSETLTARTLGGLPVTKVKETSPFLNLGIYGDSGVGKTVLAGSAANVEGMYPVICVDCEDGTESLRRTYPSVDVVRVKDMKELQNVYSELFRGGHGYRTVILDSTTEAQVFNMALIMKEKIEQEPDADPDLPEWKHHNKNLIRMRAIIRGFRDLPMHTIFTSLVMEDKDQKTGVTKIMPKYSGAFKLEYAALIDVLLYYYTKEVDEEDGKVNKRFLLSQKTEKYVAKDRTATLPIVLESPTMQDLFNIMNDVKDLSELAPAPENKEEVPPIDGDKKQEAQEIKSSPSNELNI